MEKKQKASKQILGKKSRAAGKRFELKVNKYSLANKKRWANPEYKKRVGKAITNLF